MVKKKKSETKRVTKPIKWAATRFAQEMLEWLNLGACEVTVAMDNGQVITIRNPGIEVIDEPSRVTLIDPGGM